MKKKDKILEQITGLLAVMYYFLLQLVADTAGFKLTDHPVITLTLLSVLTVGSFLIIKQGVCLFDKTHDNGKEED